MPENLHPTAQVTELYDPEIHPPPRNKHLLLINPGGVLIIGFWFDGCLAWGFKPRIPQSVKDRNVKRLERLIESQA